MKFAHIADTHIKNLKYHYEYKKVFEKLYESLREEKVDYIIHCGDIAHTKTQISPEFVEMCSDFFNNLASIAPTYIILGNHDGNLRNSNRQDALTPIANALDHPELHLLKYSGETKLNENFTINVLSVFDRDNWCHPSDPDSINIALYHGAISNSRTDLGWIMEHGEDDLSIFEGYDFAFLGDIHKTNQILDHDGRCRYPGSTVQQNHGETDDKGFLLWEIDNKDSFTCRHIVLKNPKPFVTIELTPKGRIPSRTKIQDGARLRLVSNNNLPLEKMRKAIDVAKVRFKPESITFLNRAAGQRGNVDELTGELINENLRSIAVQEELISEYLKDYQVEDQTLESIYKLNRKYNTIIESDEEVSRNINWKLNTLEWDNLFNYDEGNKIDFNKLSGIVGIFGKNYSGKSSIIDSVLYTLFNSTSKSERKNLNIINQNKEFGQGKLKLSIGDTEYSISRHSEKYLKKLKGEETLEAKTDVDFSLYDPVMRETQSLNSLSRNETDKHIRKYFGTLDDFLLTSMASQLGSLDFISEGSTRRKEILAKFLDLEIFDKKYKLAKDDIADVKGAIKRLEGCEFDEEILLAAAELRANEELTKKHSNKCHAIKVKIHDSKERINSCEREVDAIPAEIINIDELESSLANSNNTSAGLIADNIKLREKHHNKKQVLEKINAFLSEFDNEELQGKKELLLEKEKQLDNIINDIANQEIKFKNQSKKAELLKEVPCGSEYSHCKFIKDAYVAIDKLKVTEHTCTKLGAGRIKVEKEIAELEPEKLDRYMEKHEKLLRKQEKLETEINTDKLQLEKQEIQNNALELEIQALTEKIEDYYQNKEIIENKGAILKEIDELCAEVDVQALLLQECEEEMLELYKQHGSLEQKKINLQEQKQELSELQEIYSAYDLFMRCMHTSGISYDIIKKKLPVINNEIAKILANIVNFEVFFEDDGKKLKMFIKHPSHDARPLSLGSGAEKTIAAMAIRLALLSVSNLPKGNIFILDEPGTALDENNMEGFVRMLDLIKTHFKIVLLISHLDSLKDCVDMQISIDKQGAYAHVEI